MKQFPGVVLALALSIAAVWGAESRDTLVRNDRSDVLASGKWIYNDFKKGREEAISTGKPMLVVVRCIPCTACKGFDARVLSYDPQIEDLMKKFVCVRIVQGNGLDLELFEHDYDLSFAAYFLNPDKTIYGRFGSRSDHQEAERDISIEGFRKGMRAALDLHDKYPENKNVLKKKGGSTPRYASPEFYPSLQGRYTAKLDYQGKVAGSCIHCHQIGEAERLVHRSANEPIPDRLLYPWPMPDLLGFSLDPKEIARVRAVSEGTPAGDAGLQIGDDIVELEHQPIISIADVQWILHNSGSAEILSGKVKRGSAIRDLRLRLPHEWRRKSDISWRPTSWDLRRMATGGMVLKDATPEERQELGLKDSDLALRVDYLGQYGEHAVGKQAGFKKDDVIISFDGQKDRMNESEVFGYVTRTRMAGSKVPVRVMRKGEKMDFELTMQ
jgi:serine protease Do